MSHGSSDKCEPNFTPLLDLVLQLVMFFMLCANFVMDQTSVEIKLPEAIAAKALDRTEDYAIYLNVTERPFERDGKATTDWVVVLTPSDQYKDGAGNVVTTLDNPAQVKSFLDRRAKEDKDRVKHAKSIGKWVEGTPELSIIILRVHKNCPWDKTYGIMKACRQAGYLRVQLRAVVGRGDL
jgi:biopolymer transport protein ExbD